MTRRAVIAAPVVLLASAGPVLAQTLGQGTDTDIPWVRLTAALILCVGLAVGAAFALNRRLNGGPALPGGWRRILEQMGRPVSGPSSARLTDIETRRLSPQVTVSVFKCDGRSFMVTTSVQGQIVLVSLDDDGDAGA
jgi:hypothetical protein